MKRARKILMFLTILRGTETTSPPAFSPSLDFSDARNSQYLILGWI